MHSTGKIRLGVLCLVLALALGTAARADGCRCGEPPEHSPNERRTGAWYWELHPDGYAVLTGSIYNGNGGIDWEGDWAEYPGEPSDTLTVPAELEGYPVREIASGAFSSGNYPDHIALPEGIATIRFWAFFLPNLQSLSLPATLTAMEDGAIFECTALERIELAGGNTSFQLLDGLLLSADGKKLIICPSALESGTVTVPDGVETIGSYAIAEAHMREIVFPESLTALSSNAVSWCRELERITIPANIQSIGSYALYSTADTVIFSGFPRSMGTLVFNPKQFSHITFHFGFLPHPETGYRFSCQEALVRFAETGELEVLPPPPPPVLELETRATGAWYWKLHPDGYAIISGYSNHVQDGQNTRGGASEDTLAVPAELEGYPVREIGSYAISGTSLPENLVLPEGLTTIRASAFDESGIRTVAIPSTVTEIEDGAFNYCHALERITVAPDNPSYRIVDGLLLSATGRDLIACPVRLEQGALTVPEGVQVIHRNAFLCAELTELIFPESVTTIRSDAVCVCPQLSRVVLPAGIQTIEDLAISSQTELDIILNSLPQSIGCDSFFSPATDIYCTFLPHPETPHRFVNADEMTAYIQSGGPAGEGPQTAPVSPALLWCALGGAALACFLRRKKCGQSPHKS